METAKRCIKKRVSMGLIKHHAMKIYGEVEV
jgi:hypothetical protein